MKVLFVGPSLFDLIENGMLSWAPEIRCLPPAQQGDILRAVMRGATVIGLIDGRYEDVAAPWHKEILFALSEGVCVLGGGSLGALRAAECHAYGMIGVGTIFESYLNGQRIDDSDVAQLHGPAELQYMPITEALVNVQATVTYLFEARSITFLELCILSDNARRMFFKDLTFENLLKTTEFSPERIGTILALCKHYYIDEKRKDALSLVEFMNNISSERRIEPKNWSFAATPMWNNFLELEYGRNFTLYK